MNILLLVTTTYAATTKTDERLPTVNLGDPFGLGHITSLGQLFSYLVAPAFIIAGIAVLIYFVLAAVKLIYSGGDKAQVQAAREMITHSIIGVILLLVMFFVLPFVLSYFGVNIKIF